MQSFHIYGIRREENYWGLITITDTICRVEPMLLTAMQGTRRDIWANVSFWHDDIAAAR
jgi:hypothetical protein